MADTVTVVYEAPIYLEVDVQAGVVRSARLSDEDAELRLGRTVDVGAETGVPRSAVRKAVVVAETALWPALRIGL